MVNGQPMLPLTMGKPDEVRNLLINPQRIVDVGKARASNPLDTIAALVGDTTSIEALNQRTKGALRAAQQFRKSPVALGAIMDALLGDTQTMLTVGRNDTAAVKAMATAAALLGATEELTQLLQHFPLQPEQLTAAWLWAAAVGQVPILEKLHRYGVALTANIYGQTAIHGAARGNQPTGLQWLHKHGAALDPQNNSGETPLYGAAEENAVDCVKILLVHGADPTVTDNDGDTPLYVAARKNAVDCVTVLLAHGADPTVANKAGDTPFYIAQGKGHSAVVALLEAAIATAPKA